VFVYVFRSRKFFSVIKSPPAEFGEQEIMIMSVEMACGIKLGRPGNDGTIVSKSICVERPNSLYLVHLFFFHLQIAMTEPSCRTRRPQISHPESHTVLLFEIF
jgi:hypothetical protein